MFFLCIMFHFFLPLYIFVYHITFFFFNDTATTEIYTLSLHDALPIYAAGVPGGFHGFDRFASADDRRPFGDRKSTRLNSSHRCISYAVFCLKKKKKRYLGLTLLRKTTIFLRNSRIPRL